jgi:hypothetical protein
VTGSGKTSIYGPEPWKTKRNTVLSYWDLWFSVVALADHGGDLDALVAAIEDGGGSFWSGTVEAKLSHLDDLKRRMAEAGVDARGLAGSQEADAPVRGKARTKVLKQGLYPRDLTDAMRHTPRERLYERSSPTPSSRSSRPRSPPKIGARISASCWCGRTGGCSIATKPSRSRRSTGVC